MCYCPQTLDALEALAVGHWDNKETQKLYDSMMSVAIAKGKRCNNTNNNNNNNRARLMFAVLRSTILCLRGSRSKWRSLGLEDGAPLRLIMQ